MIYELNGVVPLIGKNVFLAPTSVVIGDVCIGEESSVWFHAVLRGDIDKISIGHHTNIQDHSLLHIKAGIELEVGSCVTIGHHVILHSCKIGDHSLIGMGSTILDGAVIGNNSVVAASSLVPPKKIFPPYSLIMGSPAKVVRSLTQDEIKNYGDHYLSYIETKKYYMAQTFRPVDF